MTAGKDEIVAYLRSDLPKGEHRMHDDETGELVAIGVGTLASRARLLEAANEIEQLRYERDTAKRETATLLAWMRDRAKRNPYTPTLEDIDVWEAQLPLAVATELRTANEGNNVVAGIDVDGKFWNKAREPVEVRAQVDSEGNARLYPDRKPTDES